MSDSDDTDELLLMTPQIQHHIVEAAHVPYYNIVDKLITQVSKLKCRLTSIENSSDVSLGSATNSVETFLNMQSSDPNNACRRCLSFESIPQGSESRRSTIPSCFSTQSTPQKPRSKLMLKAFPNSPKYDDELKSFKKPYRTSPRSKVVEGGIDMPKQPLTEESNIIDEIDNFLCSVRPFKTNTARALDFGVSIPSKQQSKTAVDVNQIFKEMDMQEEKLKNFYVVNGESTSTNSSDGNSEPRLLDWRKGTESTSVSSTESSSLTDKSTVLYQPTVKKQETMNTEENGKSTEHHLDPQSRIHGLDQKVITNNKHSNNNNLRNEKNTIDNISNPSISSRKSLSSPNCDIHSNAKDMMTMHQKLLDETHSPEFNSYHDPTRRLMKPVSDQRLGSVSLINLWTNDKKETEKNSDKCIQKLQEEKLRRTHCEELIQQLQNKILEQQEKLAVAIQVDEAKDNAILRFHDAWEKASMKFKLVVKERDQLQEDLQKLAGQNKRTVEECEERIDFHRKEAHQALSIMQEHKVNLEELNKKYGEIRDENETLKTTNKQLVEKMDKIEEKNKQLSNILANKELELNESKNILLHAKKEVSQCQAAVEMCQKDFSTIKTEYELLQEENKCEKNRVLQLLEQEKVIQEELEVQRNRERSLLDDLKKVQEKLDSNKRELRNFYQGQVELLVQNKLKEFQKQLDDAEQKMKEQLEKKELEIAKSAALHIQQISDKYTLEINLLEQKHQEEMQLKQVKIAQLEQRLYEMHSRLERQQDKRSELIRQLQKVMEAQWSEALRIINNGKSPTPQEETSGTLDQLHSLQSRSYQNMEALLSQEFDERGRNQRHGFNESEGFHHTVQSDRKNHHRKENQGQRSSQPSRSKGSKQHEDGHLQKYINMLLQKQPGNPVDSRDKTAPSKLPNEQPTTDVSKWQRTENPQFLSDFFESQNQKDARKKWK